MQDPIKGMNGQINRCMDEWYVYDDWIESQMDNRINKWTDRPVD